MRLSFEDLRNKFMGKSIRVAYNPDSDWPKELDNTIVNVIDVVDRFNYPGSQRIKVELPDTFVDWWVVEEDVNLVEEETRLISTIKVYPHICKICRSPSRRIDKTVLCSNIKCKTRALFAKIYKPRIILDNLANSRLNPIPLRCPVCNDIIITLYSLPKLEYMDCINAHKTSINHFITGYWYEYNPDTSVSRGRRRITKRTDNQSGGFCDGFYPENEIF